MSDTKAGVAAQALAVAVLGRHRAARLLAGEPILTLVADEGTGGRLGARYPARHTAA